MGKSKLSIQGRSVVFVDDRLEVTKVYISCIAGAGGNVVYLNTIEKATSLLLQTPPDIAVIDLHMRLPDPLPLELQEFSTLFLPISSSSLSEKRGLNGGQILGMLINKHLKGKVKFLYLSAVGAHYENLPNGEPTGINKCYDKYETSPRELLDAIIKVL